MPLIQKADRHSVKVKSAKLGESKTGTPFVELEFENASAETILGWLYLSEAAFERSVQVLRETFGFDNNFETLPAQLQDKSCSITTEFENFEGKDRLKVKWINPLRSTIPLKEGESALKKFSQMASRVPNEAPKAAPKAAPAPAAKKDPF
jgi:hypothetical protein